MSGLIALAMASGCSEMAEPREPDETASQISGEAPQRASNPPQTVRTSVQQVKASTEQPAAQKEAVRDPAVLARLDEMGKFLREQKNFYVKAHVVTDEIMDSGQKIQLVADVDLWVSRPNALRAKMTSDRKDREIIYDGKSFTLFGQRAGYYATAHAPPTLDELMGVLSDQYDIEAPFVDLFYWGTPRGGVNAVERAENIGPATVNGILCDQLAMHQPDVDWQVWIEKGDKPLPRRLVITTLTEPEKPQHEVTYEWKLNQVKPAAFFKFTPPKGAKQIPFEGRSTGKK